MRIGIIRDTFFTNEPRGLNIANVLTKNGFEIFVLCFGEKKSVEKIDGVTLVRFHINNIIRRKISSLVETIPIYKYIWARKIKRLIIEHNIDVLQVHDLYMLGPAIKANKRFNLPIVANFHENYPAAIKSYNWANSALGKVLIRPKIWEKLEGKYLSKISKLILLSESFKELLTNRYNFLDPKDVVVYPNVPDLEKFQSYKIDENIYNKGDDFILFYFGVVAERRGIFTTIEMLKLIKTKNIKLLIIGPVDHADKNKFHSYLNDPELKNLITYHPWKDIKELPSYLHISDVCISPIVKNAQHDSGVANKIFQYMLYGKPLVVSNSTEQKKIVEECNCGMVYTHDNPREMAENILSLYQNPELCEKLGANGQKAVKEKYNLKEQSKKIIQLYKELERTLTHAS